MPSAGMIGKQRMGNNMAKVTITFEDIENSTVITSEPGLSELLAKANNPQNMTEAEANALEAWHAILQQAKTAARQQDDNPLH